MAFEHILQPLLDAGMIRKAIESNDIYDGYSYTPKALNLIGVRTNWQFGIVFKDESSLRVWLPVKRHTNSQGATIGGFDDRNHYSYVTVDNIQTDLYGTEFEERVMELFDGLSVPYEGFNDDYIELDDLCL